MDRLAQTTIIFFRPKEKCYWLLHIDSNSESQKKVCEDLDFLKQRIEDAAAPSADDKLEDKSFPSSSQTNLARFGRKTTVLQTEYASKPCSSCSMSQPTTANQLEDLIAAASNVHCLLDPVPSSLIKNGASLLSPYLSVLCNQSLEDIHFPISQKAAIIKLLVRKRGRDTTCRKNYRRVSNLTVSKKQ